MENSYVPFITVFLNKFLYNKLEDFLIDDSNNIDHDLDMELGLLTMTNALTMDMMLEIDQFYITLIRISKNKVSLHNMDSGVQTFMI